MGLGLGLELEGAHRLHQPAEGGDGVGEVVRVVDRLLLVLAQLGLLRVRVRVRVGVGFGLELGLGLGLG